MKPLDNCPFCGEQFKEEYVGDDIREYCCRGKDDHTYIQTCLVSSNETLKFIMRVGPGDVRYYLKVNFMNNYTKTWAGRFNEDENNKTHISQAVEPDFSKGMTGIIKQIKLYLTFS